MEQLASLGTLACVVLAIFAGVAYPWARRLDRRDVNEAVKENQSKGDN